MNSTTPDWNNAASESKMSVDDISAVYAELEAIESNPNKQIGPSRCVHIISSNALKNLKRLLKEAEAPMNSEKLRSILDYIRIRQGLDSDADACRWLAEHEFHRLVSPHTIRGWSIGRTPAAVFHPILERLAREARLCKQQSRI